MKNLIILIAGVFFTIGLSAQITRPNLRLIPIDGGGGNTDTYYRDADGDTFGNANVSFQFGVPISGWVLNRLDCNDADASITTGIIWYRDLDGDGFGDPNTTWTSCTQPIGYVSNNNDGCPLESGTNNGCPASSSGFSNENYIHSTTYLQPFALGQEDNAQETQKIENIIYFDGLGRPIQQIGIRQSPLEKDIITHLTYDNLGRQAKGYLPYASTSGSGIYRTDALTKTNAFYNTSKYQNTTNPYSEQFFDETPLNLVVEQAAPGNAWKEGISNEHTIKNEYKLIENTDQVYNFHVTYSSSGIPQLVNKGYFYIGEQEIIQGQETYNTPTLYKFIVKNENWVSTDGNDNTAHIIKDFQGRIILSRAFENNVKHDTYNVYDNYGKLIYVIPPKVTINNGVSGTELNKLCFQYKYDTKDRLIEKKIPGKGWEYIVYNKFNQPILTQDAKQRSKTTKEWLYSKFDAFGRVVYTGIYKDNRSRSSVQASAHAHASTYEAKGGTLYSYTKNAYPTNITTVDVLTVNYYDDYNFDTSGLSVPASVYGVTRTANTKGLVTGVKEKVLDTNHWIITITGYDKKARAIYVASKNQFLNTTDVNRIKFNFAGKVEESTATHTSNTTVSIVDKFTYDHVGRLLTQKQKINTQAEELIVKNKYDELGSLENKKVGNTEAKPLQTIDYTYNIRGWLTGINDVNNIGTDLFTFKINYNSKDISATTGYTPLYNGDITETIWRTKSDNKKRAYQYKYDALSRIKGANYRENDNLLSGSGKFETSYDYDKNGNLNSLHRNGSTGSAIDVLSYSYAISSNKLTNIGETSGNSEGLSSSSNYTYESNNGNLIIDTSKGITNITYNYLNLPTKVEFGSTKRIEYIYTATGVKLQKKVTNGSVTTTNYAGSFIYEQDVLKHFSHPEGYVEVNGSSFKYIYQYADHLGNIRLNYTNIGTSAIPNLQIREENNYYPFGLKHKGYNNVINGAQDKFKYNSKELQTEIINGKALEWYDYGARNYDPTIGRWFVVDAFAEKAPNLTPFRYGFNNPINVIDPDGNFEQDDFFGGGFVSSLTIYGEAGGPITIGGGSGPDVHVVRYADGSVSVISKAEYGQLVGDGVKEESANDFSGNEGGNCCGEGSVNNGDGTTTLTHGQISYTTKTVTIGGADETKKTKEGSLGLSWMTPAGIGAILSGTRFTFLKPVATLGSQKGTTLISIASRNIKGNVFTKYGKNSFTKYLVRKAQTAGTGAIIGRVGSRFIPFVGWGLTFYDIGTYLHNDAQQTIQNQYGGDAEAYHRDLRKLSKSIRICFVAGTKISLANQTTKNIEDIKVGNIVKTYNLRTKEIENNKVLKIDSPIHENLIKITFDNMIFNINTMDHPYYVKGKGWCSFSPNQTQSKYGIKVEQLYENDICYFLGENNKLIEVKITKIDKTDRKERTYNLSDVENNHNFFANGILVHNKLK